MLSRENQVMLAGLTLGLLVFVGFALLTPQAPGLIWPAVFLLIFYGVAIGGPHLYLYRRSEGGEIPRSARARFLVALSVFLPLWTGSMIFQDVTVANVGLDVALVALSLVAFLVYFVNEARHGYADFAEEAGLR